jgi:hypothetical protein
MLTIGDQDVRGALTRAIAEQNVSSPARRSSHFAAERMQTPGCVRHRLPKGAVMTIPALWSFAQDWYGGYLQMPWRKRSGEATRALFERHGLTGAFWAVD